MRVPPPPATRLLSSGTDHTAFNLLPVPTSLVERATSGRYCELAEFLPESWQQVEGSEVRLQLQEGGVLAVDTSTTRRRDIKNIFQWTEAFSAYASILAQHDPARGPQLFGYQANILRSAREFSGTRWLEYDKAFRKLAAANYAGCINTDWSQLDLQLYNRIFVGHARPPTTSCHETSAEHFSRSGPATKRPKPDQAGPYRSASQEGVDISLPEATVHKGKEICRKFNSRKSCTWPQCARAHVCSKPGCQLSHPAYLCSATAQ